MNKNYTILITLALVFSLGVNIYAIGKITNLDQKQEVNKNFVSEDEYYESLLKIIHNIDVYNDQDYDYKSLVIMAESGLKHLETIPSVDALEDLTDTARLPAGYTLYGDKDPGTNTYIRYRGEKLIPGDVVARVDQWYGPF